MEPSDTLLKESASPAIRPSPLRTKFASLFVCVHSKIQSPDIPQAISAMLGLAGPIALGAATGHIGTGMITSLGGLALSGGVKGNTVREQVRDLLYSIIAGGAAVFTGSILAGHSTKNVFAIPAVAAVATLLGRISRPLARAATVFVLFFVIAENLGAHGIHPAGLTFLFLIGALWTAILSLILKELCRLLRLYKISHDSAQSSRYPAKLLMRRWAKSLTRLSGWQYTFRLTLCLVTGQGLELAWPHHHGYWVLITIIIVVQRDLQMALKRTRERAAGTTLGILLVGLLMLVSSSTWSVVAAIAVLAAARSILMQTNYTAYATVQTPLILLLLDFGRSTSWTIVADRLIATLAGCAIAMTMGYLGWSRIVPPARGTGVRKGMVK
jgi:hypothetical protein